MRDKTVVYPGTFDPIHKGHVDLVERAAVLFDRVVIGVAKSSSKKPLFTTEERITLTEQSLAHLDNIEVKGFSGLSTAFVAAQNANTVLRGIRTAGDFEYERQLFFGSTSLWQWLKKRIDDQPRREPQPTAHR